MAGDTFDAYHQKIELTNEQKACVDYKGNRTLVVKGYAGAGKSVVLMEIAKEYLKKLGSNAKGRIAIFTFQNTLVSSTKEYLKANGYDEESVTISTANSYITSIYDALVKSNKAPRNMYPYSGKAGDAKRVTNVKNAIKQHQALFGKHRFHAIEPEFWVEEFDWMKDMNVWLDDLDVYLTYQRKGRGGKVRMSAADRVTAYQLFTCYCKELERTKQGDWSDQTLFVNKKPELIPDSMRFDYILIDEAQDLSLAQMDAIMKICRKNVVIAMDMNQRIFSKQWTPKLLGIETTTKKLTKSMRTTAEIDALAESVRSKNDEILSEDDKSLRAIPERHGDIPTLVHLEDAAAEKKYVINLIKQSLKNNDKITIGVIAAKNKQINVFSEWFTDADITHELISKESEFSVRKPGVKLTTAFGAKGLEFDVVIIPAFAEGNFPYSFMPDDEEAYEQYMVKMRNLVYVSMTRARFSLFITFYGQKGSRFITEMDPKLYKLVGEMPNIQVPKFIPKTQPENEEGTKQEDSSFSVKKKKDINPITASTASSEKQSTKNANSEKKKPVVSSISKDDLVGFLRKKGIEPIDKRPQGGGLWIVGDKSLKPVIQEMKEKFGCLWIYCENGSASTKRKPSWFTKSAK